MKNFIKTILCCFVAVTIFMCTSCSKSDDNTENSQPTINAEYYKGLGYHTITFDNHTKIICENENKVTIDSNTIMVANNTNITIAFNTDNSEYILNNGNYVSYTSGKILSSFNVNTSIIDLDNTTIKTKEDLSISANFSNFKTIGVAVYAAILHNEEYNKFVNNEFSNQEILSYNSNTITTSLNNLLFTYSNTATTKNDFFETALNSNTTFKSETSNLNNDKFKVKLSLEIFIETTEVFCYLILKDAENNIHLFKVDSHKDFFNNSISLENLSNENSNLDKIEIILSDNLSFSDL